MQIVLDKASLKLEKYIIFSHFYIAFFPLCSLVSAKDYVQLNTQQMQTTLPQDTDLQETRAGSVSDGYISMGSRYLKPLFPQQNQYTPRVIQ